jgi:outer membrane protein OmpA-like peptidoglycan-associated protein
MTNRFIKTTLAFVLLTQVVFAQKQKFAGPKKGPNVGIAANMTDFEKYAGGGDFGFSLMFWNGLSKYVDYSVRYNGLFTDYAMKKSTTGGYAGELDLSFHLRPMTDDHLLSPFISAGVSGGHYGKWNDPGNGSYSGNTNWAALVPLGGGLQFNFASKTYLFLQAAYRWSPSDAHLDNNMFYSLGLTKALKRKPADRDQDGVVDSSDACPDVAGPASLHGCPDKDGDGIADKDDQCPDVAGTVALHGCPDKDGDGIADKDDKCPDVKGTLKYNGCPIPDSDKDGINDEEDKCPTVAGLAKYQGCPVPDTDGDGINDESDKCPTVAGTAKYNGCPVPDTDGDGVNDEQDKCPNKPGPADNYGCPVIGIDPHLITFKTGSAVLLPEGKKILDTVVNYLKNNPEVNVMIEGHTDNTGTDKINNPLSEKRAESTKAYMVKQGIDADRMTTQGFGSTQPVDDNNTAKGRSLNRRIEIKVKQ